MVRRRSWRTSSWIRATVLGVVQLVGLPVCSSSSSDLPTGLEPGMPLKHLRTTQALVPECLLNHCEGRRSTFPKIGTKFDAHSLFLSLIHSENRHRSRTRLTPNKRVWKLPTSTQLRATWHSDSLDMVVLQSTGASRYHNCCIDGGTSPENFRYHLVSPQSGSLSIV